MRTTLVGVSRQLYPVDEVAVGEKVRGQKQQTRTPSPGHDRGIEPVARLQVPVGSLRSL